MGMAEDILSTDELRAVKVTVPEWNLDVYVAELRADERDEFETKWIAYREASEKEDNVGFRAFTAAYCLCDESRNRLYQTDEQFFTAFHAFRNKRASAIDRIFGMAAKLSGLTKSDEEELLKN